MSRIITVIAVSLLLAGTARAEIMVGWTAEWMSHKSELIAVATPMRVETFKGPGEVWCTQTRFLLKQVLKGPQTDGDTATVFDYAFNTKDVLGFADAAREKKTLLIFCDVAENRFTEIDGRYVLTVTHEFKSAYFEGAQVKDLYTPQLGHLSDYGEVIKRARAQVAHERGLRERNWRGTVERHALEVPFGCDLYNSLYGGSACYLFVPRYRKKEPEGRTESPLPLPRAHRRAH